MLSRFLDPKNDFAFKKVFGTEKHKDILIHFINDVLGQSEVIKGDIKVVAVEFLSPIQDPEALAKKQSIVDVLCKDQNGKKYIIEMQVARREGFESRAQYYAAKAYTNQMDKGGLYEDLKEVIFIAILDYEVFPKKAHYKSNHTIRDDLTNERDLDGLRFVFIELPRFDKKLEELSTMLEKWCYFFKYAQETTPEELAQLVKNEPIIKEAYEALDSYYWNEQDLMRYEHELKNEWDAKAILRYRERVAREAAEKEAREAVEKSEKIGIEKGKTEERREMAKKMQTAGIALEIIKKVTGLKIEEIGKLD